MTIKILSVLMILIGAAFLFLSFSPAMKIWKNVSGRVRRKWLIILYLMGFFILGYLSFDIILISNLPFPLELVTGGVFLGGAIFVYIIINISLSTVAAQQKAEEAIIVAKDDWENTFDAVTDMVTVHDMDFNIIRANPAAKAIFGVQPNEQIPLLKCFRCYHGTDKPPAECASCLSLKTQAPSTVEIYEPYLNRHLEIRAMPRFGKDRRLVGLIHVVRDITDRKRAEEEKSGLEERLNRAEKMEALGILAGGVAHDLNNVLGIVVGYSELLLIKTDLSSPIRPKLLEIMKGGQKAAAMVQDLLTLARRGVPATDVLNLNNIISECRNSPEFMQLSSFHPNILIQTELEPGLPNISGSSVHLGKTIFNLASNASEAMPKGGILTIRTANHYLDKPIHGYDEIREGDYVVISVSDTGEGIDAADMKRIFEPFYTKKIMGRSGTGLGLAVVWGTVKDHHGYINVQSEEGKGSTFTLYFPVTKKELSPGRNALPVSEYMGKGESVLIVDDVKEQRDLAAAMLKEFNYSVASVGSGEEAVEYLKKKKADLMILDMIMDPGIDGLDTYRRVLEIHPKQKAIIVSGFSESDRVRAAQALGAGAYLKKPYDMEKLGLAAKKELDRAV